VETIFLGTTQKDIIKVFSAFGEILETNIVETESKRFGFVTFKDIATADAVLSYYYRGVDFYINGYVAKLNRAHFKPKHRMPTRAFNLSWEKNGSSRMLAAKTTWPRVRYSSIQTNLVSAKQPVTLAPRSRSRVSQSALQLHCDQVSAHSCCPRQFGTSQRLTEQHGGCRYLPPVPFIAGMPTKSLSQPALSVQTHTAVPVAAASSLGHTYPLLPGLWCYNSSCELSVP